MDAMERLAGMRRASTTSKPGPAHCVRTLRHRRWRPPELVEEREARPSASVAVDGEGQA